MDCLEIIKVENLKSPKNSRLTNSLLVLSIAIK